MSKVMWSFKTKNFTVRWLIDEDELDTRDMDSALAKKCRKNVDSGKWQCFMSEIQVVENSGKEVLGQAYLGGSIYAKPAEFRDHFGMNTKGHGSYFSQMVREAIDEARKTFPAFQKKAQIQLEQKQNLVSLNLRTQ